MQLIQKKKIAIELILYAISAAQNGLGHMFDFFTAQVCNPQWPQPRGSQEVCLH